MSAPTFQTVHLDGGKHRSPEDGACVVELSSMIAGEEFSDRPDSVCRVIAAVLRPFNDATGPRRSELYGCASAIVGTRGGPPLERRRVARCLAELDELAAAGGRLRRLRCRMAVRRVRRLGEARELNEIGIDQFGFALVRVLRRHDPQWHERLVALTLDLAAMTQRTRRPDGARWRSTPGRGAGAAR
jgi:hypothetical protein